MKRESLLTDLKFKKANETDYKNYKECIIDNKIVIIKFWSYDYE